MNMKRVANFIIEKRLPILLAMIGITIFFLYQAITHLTVKTIYADLLPSNHAYTKLHHQIESKFGGSNQVLIMLQVRDREDGGKYDDIFNFETLKKVKAITEKLYLFPGVDRNKIMSLASRSMRDIKITTEGMTLDNIMFPDVPDDAGRAGQPAASTSTEAPWYTRRLCRLTAKKPSSWLIFSRSRLITRNCSNNLPLCARNSRTKTSSSTSPASPCTLGTSTTT